MQVFDKPLLLLNRVLLSDHLWPGTQCLLDVADEWLWSLYYILSGALYASSQILAHSELTFFPNSNFLKESLNRSSGGAMLSWSTGLNQSPGSPQVAGNVMLTYVFKALAQIVEGEYPRHFTKHSRGGETHRSLSTVTDCEQLREKKWDLQVIRALEQKRQGVNQSETQICPHTLNTMNLQALLPIYDTIVPTGSSGDVGLYKYRTERQSLLQNVYALSS